ncbi:hypothetical protein M8C21_029946, partial [Ambrosia artemisiifolia]
AQRLNDLGDESRLLPLWRQASVAEPRFLWNNYMLEVLIDNKQVMFHFDIDQNYCFKGLNVGLRIVGLLYDDISLQNVLDMTVDSTREERQMLRNKDGMERRGYKETWFLNEVAE